MKTRLLFFLAINLLTVANRLHAQGTPSVTITNPTPAATGFDYFGNAVAAVGADKVLIGAIQDFNGGSSAGAAYLFNIYGTNGTLLTNFFNPTPKANSTEEFGNAVASVGTDKLLIGCRGASRAYLFSTNGGTSITFTNPNPINGGGFGYAVAAVGTDKVLIGAPTDYTVGVLAGAAYLFSTNGTLVTSFFNPNPSPIFGVHEGFGAAVTAVGTDKVLIGANGDGIGAAGAGAAYLFNTDGGPPLITFTNPAPAQGDSFGIAVAAVGTNKVLIGAWLGDAGVTNAGAAYLYDIYSTNGTLLTNGGNLVMTFTNPTPADSDFFGYAVAAMGTDKVLVGAYNDDTGATNAGAAYLFNTNGALLTTFTNPAPAITENFGYAVTAVGRDKVLIGARGDNAGAILQTGAAYLYDIGPTLQYSQPSRNTLIFTWPVAWTGFALQSTTNVVTPNWVDVTNAVTIVGNLNQVTIATLLAIDNFRLSHP